MDFRFVLEADEQSIWKDPKYTCTMLLIWSFRKCQEWHHDASGHMEQHPDLPVLAHQLLSAPSIVAIRSQQLKVFSVYKENQNSQVWFWFMDFDISV